MAFELQNDRPAKPRREYSTEKTRQTVLFAGLDCLPGQLDLFGTDGQPDEENTDDNTTEKKPE